MGLFGDDADILPIRLWSHVGVHHWQDGRLSGYTAAELRSACGFRGIAEKLEEGLLRLKFIFTIPESDGGGYSLAPEDFDARLSHIRKFKAKGRALVEAREELKRSRTDSTTYSSTHSLTGSGAGSSTPYSTDSPTPTNPPTHRPTDRPTNPPTGPPTAGVGSNGVRVGAGNGMGFGRALDDAAREVQVQGLLAQADVGPEMQRVLSHRRDITPARVEREIRAIQGDPKVDNLASVLVHRLQQVERRPR